MSEPAAKIVFPRITHETVNELMCDIPNINLLNQAYFQREQPAIQDFAAFLAEHLAPSLKVRTEQYFSISLVGMSLMYCLLKRQMEKGV
jgi:hypothetical protein